MENVVLDLIKHVDPFPNSSKSHYRFYKLVLEKLSTLPRLKVDTEVLRGWALMHVLIERLQALAEEKRMAVRQNSDTSAINDEISTVVKASEQMACRDMLLELDYKKEGLSPPDDFEGGLGFYSLQAPLVTEAAESCQFYLPCCLSAFTRPLLGVAFTILTAMFHKSAQTQDEGNLRHMMIMVEKTTHRMRNALRGMSENDAQKLCAILSTWITFHKSNVRATRSLPIWPMLDSQVFYEEGVRLYQRENQIAERTAKVSEVYISATSSGLIQPHEFYGFGYEPGISKRCPPEAFAFANLIGHAPEYRHWDERCCDRIKADLQNILGDAKGSLNVFRPLYFVNGIGADHPWVQKHYFVLGSEQQEHSLSSEQNEDRAALRRFFKSRVTLHFIPQSTFEQQRYDFLRYYTLFGSHTLLRSARLGGPRISHGWWYDLDMIREYDSDIERVVAALGCPPSVGELVARVAKDSLKVMSDALIDRLTGVPPVVPIAKAVKNLGIELGVPSLQYLASFARRTTPPIGEYWMRIRELTEKYPAEQW